MLLFIAAEDDIQTQPFADTKTPVLEQFYSKETPTQVFSYEYCKTFKDSFLYRSPPVAVSGHLYYFLTFSSCYVHRSPIAIEWHVFFSLCIEIFRSRISKRKNVTLIKRARASSQIKGRVSGEF